MLLRVLSAMSFVPLHTALFAVEASGNEQHVFNADGTVSILEGTASIHQRNTRVSRQHRSPVWIHKESARRSQQRGYLTTAFGDTFRRTAEQLCMSIRHSGDNTPFAVVTSEAEAFTVHAETKGCFDVVVPYSVGSYKVSMFNNERYNVFPMLSLLELTPFNETIFYDSDVLRTRNVNLWDIMQKYSATMQQPVIAIGKHRDCSWHFGTACKLEERNNMSIPHTKAGLMYVRKGVEAEWFWHHMHVADDRYEKLGFSRSCEHAMCLEIHLSYAFSKMKWKPVELADQDLLCFNWNRDEELPPRILNDPSEKQPTDGRNYSHVHMFGSPADAEILFSKLVPLNSSSGHSAGHLNLPSSPAAASLTSLVRRQV